MCFGSLQCARAFQLGTLKSAPELPSWDSRRLRSCGREPETHRGNAMTLWYADNFSKFSPWLSNVGLSGHLGSANFGGGLAKRVVNLAS